MGEKLSFEKKLALRLTFTQPEAGADACFEFVGMGFGDHFLKEITRKRHCNLKIFAPAARYPTPMLFSSTVRLFDQ